MKRKEESGLMFARMTFTKTDPAHYDEAIALFPPGVAGERKERA